MTPIDIDPAKVDAGQTHFEQIQERAVKAMNNAIGVFNHANASTQKLREQAENIGAFQQTVAERENDYNNRLIEVFGYPYPDDPGYQNPPPVVLHQTLRMSTEMTKMLARVPQPIFPTGSLSTNKTMIRLGCLSTSRCQPLAPAFYFIESCRGLFPLGLHS